MAKNKKSRHVTTVFAKGEYVIAGDSQTQIKHELNENTPEHMTPSIPKAISGKEAAKMVQTKDGGFRKEYDWTRVKLPRITPKMPRLR